MELATSVYLERTRIMKRVARDIGLFNSFLGNLKELLHKADRVPFPKHHVARVHDALEYLKKNLWDVIKQNNEHLKARVMQEAYEAEYAIY
ncbi:hypothetical protein KY285_035048 [Solanum tuberosum]|nr:hypothetical protein KY285_035048 [Solanum tuberosum]